MQKYFDVLASWRERACRVTGRSLSCGHFLPEEAPGETAQALRNFFSDE
jgi:haloacetate dehalogenase